MTVVEREDKLADAKRQGQAQFDSIKEMVEALRAANEAAEQTDDGNYDEANEDARQRIQEDPLSIEVSIGWFSPGSDTNDRKPTDYRILLCTGGPAVQIVGTLSEYCEPETAELQVQDWFQPWTAMRPQVGPDDFDSEPVLLEYARQFYFGG